MCLVASVEGGTRHEAGDTVAINGELYSVDGMISQELLDALSAVGKIPSNVEASIIRGRAIKSRSRRGSNLKCL